MNTVKTEIFDWLEVSQKNLHEIELEDIRLEPLVQENIYKSIAKMISIEDPVDLSAINPVIPKGEYTCKGFWVEHTKELVLYVWIGDQARTIIIPQDGWGIREDIVIN